MYRKVAEAKFLAKAGVIITDGIRKRETQEASRQVLLFVCVCVCVCVCVYMCVCRYEFRGVSAQVPICT